jgi:hypothetical protein
MNLSKDLIAFDTKRLKTHPKPGAGAHDITSLFGQPPQRTIKAFGSFC